MTLDYDIAVPPRRPSDQARLVEAVYEATPVDESNWLEWKSELSLGTPEGRFSLARQILGFANRHPERAERAVGGLGVVLAGVAPGDCQGVNEIDVAQLESGLLPYIGDQISWSAVYVSFRNQKVLVIIVEAPQWGNQAYPLRRTYRDEKGRGADRGTIFIRREAKAEPANDSDIDMLQERLRKGQQNAVRRLDLGLEASLSLASGSLLLVDESREHHATWLRKHRQELLDEHATRLSEDDRPLGMFGSSMRALERVRRAEDYTSDVDLYIEKLDGALVEYLLDNIIRSRRNEVSVLLTNPTETNIPSVKLELSFEPSVTAYVLDRNSKPLTLPKPPDMTTQPTMKLAGYYAKMPTLNILPEVEIENGSQECRVTFTIANLRPLQRKRLPHFHLIVAPIQDRPIGAVWSATSTGLIGVARGAFQFNISDTGALNTSSVLKGREE